MNILLIDDDKECLESLGEALALNKIENVRFSNPGEAIELYKTKKFDAVVIDIKMPGMSGMDALKAIRSHNPNAYVIMVTGYPTFDDAMDALNEGAHAYFCKPLDAKILIDRLHKIKRELRVSIKKEKYYDHFIKSFARIKKDFDMFEKLVRHMRKE